MNIAYIINQYPKVSHSFIRREILALERQGNNIFRVAIRGWDADVVDDADIAERERTKYLLEAGFISLLSAGILSMIGNPKRFAKAFARAVRLSISSDRNLFLHFAYFLEACALVRLLKNENIDHLHAHFGTNSAEVADLAHKLGGPPFSFTVHGPEEFDKPRELKLREKASEAAFIVAISHFCRSRLQLTLDERDWNKIVIVHCGLGSDFLDAKAVPAPNAARLVCVGRLCREKAQIVLLRAVARLLQRGREVALVLAGDGEMRADVEAEIERLALSDHVKITGWISSVEVRRLIEDSDALVLASFAEGLPVVIMEAMALGRPVISTWVAGIPELVRSGLDGFLTAPGDELGLADTIENFLSLDQEERSRLGDNARLQVRRNHSIMVEAAKLRDAMGNPPSNRVSANY